MLPPNHFGWSTRQDTFVTINGPVLTDHPCFCPYFAHISHFFFLMILALSHLGAQLDTLNLVFISS